MSPSGGSRENVQIMWHTHTHGWVSLFKNKLKTISKLTKKLFMTKRGQSVSTVAAKTTDRTVHLQKHDQIIYRLHQQLSSVLCRTATGTRRNWSTGSSWISFCSVALHTEAARSVSWNSALLCASAGLLRAVRHMNNEYIWDCVFENFSNHLSRPVCD